MRRNQRVAALLVVCACPREPTPAHPSVQRHAELAPARAADYPFKQHRFPEMPPTWYCIGRAFSEDLTEQKAGMRLFAWALFIAINWPRHMAHEPRRPDDGWDPKTALSLDRLNTKDVFPRWNGWFDGHQTQQRFSTERHALADVPSSEGWSCNEGCLQTALRGPRFRDPVFGEHNVFDQNGERVRYEIRIGKEWFDNLAAVLDPDKHPLMPPEPEPGKLLTFTHGQCRGVGGDVEPNPGAVAIKLAWKVLAEGDARERYLVRSARSTADCGALEACNVTLGLVGMHILQKSNKYTDWIWATFEHVDNIEPTTPDLEPDLGVAPSFRDPKCEPPECCANSGHLTAKNVCRTQVTRASLDEDVRTLNGEVRRWLRDQRTVLQYYELVGVQFVPYPRGPKRPPEPPTLRNSVIETYHVAAEDRACAPQSPCGGTPQGEAVGCLECHGTALKHDFTFFVGHWLCSCDERGPWVNDRCDRILACP